MIFTKFVLKIEGGKEACFKVKDALETILAPGAHNINQTTPKVRIEPSPEMQPIINEGGRMLGFLERQGIQRLKPEWGQTLRIFQTRPEQRPILLAEFTRAGGWSIQEGNLEKAKSGLSAATVLAYGCA